MTGPSGDQFESYLWRRYRQRHQRLRVGLWIPGAPVVPRWVAEAVLALRQEQAFDVVCLCESPADGSPPVAYPFRWLLARSEGDSVGSLTTVPLPAEDWPSRIGLDLEGDSLSARSRSALAALRLDVLVQLPPVTIAGSAAHLARSGVWTLDVGPWRESRHHPGFWEEVASNHPVTTVRVLRIHDDFSSAEVVAEHDAPTAPGWRFTRNANEPLAAGSLLLHKCLLDLAAGLPRPRGQGTPWHRRGGWHTPDLLETTAFCLSQMRRTLRLRRRARGRDIAWFVAARQQRHRFTRSRSTFDPEGFEEVVLPVASEAADPFVVAHAGRNYVFFEEVPEGDSKGRIACLELSSNGAVSGYSPVLERPYHVSYPCVVRVDNEYFMLPESADNATVDLYRAVNFPYEWKLERTLQSGVRLVDTTPHFHDGLWYFFTTAFEFGLQTFLFSATAIDGPWHYHPMNPICTDARRARMAGALFHRLGQLTRPAQDCSQRYGGALVLNHVAELTPSTFREYPGEVIAASWSPDLVATHSLNSNEQVELIDGQRFC